MVFFNIIVFAWKLISYSLPIPLMILTFKKYGHWSHLGIGIANLSFLSSSIVAFILEIGVDLKNLEVTNAFIEIGWIFANIFLYSAFWIIILSLLLAQFDELPTLSHLVTLLVGFSVGLITNTDNFIVSYEAGQLSASYNELISICAGIMYIIFVVLALTPLIKKLLSGKVQFKKKQYLIILISYLVLTFWVLSLFLTRIEIIRVLRRFSLSLGMFLWAIALYVDPLTIVISKAKIQKVIIITKNGLPIFSYDFEKEKKMDSGSSLIAGLLSAIKSGMETILSSGKALKTMSFEDSIMSFINGKHVILLLLSQETISSNTQLIANIFLEDFEIEYQDLLESNIVEKEEMDNVVDLLRDVTDSVQI